MVISEVAQLGAQGKSMTTMKSAMVVVAVMLSLGCSGEREITTVSASGVQSTAVLGPSGEVCSKTTKRNPTYVGPVLVVRLLLGDDSPTLTLTPSSSGLGGGSWSSGDVKLSFDWVDDGLSVELVRDGGLVEKGVAPIGAATLSLGGELLKFDSRVETMGKSPNTGSHARGNVAPMQVPLCSCGQKGCEPGNNCCAKSSLCCSCCNSGCDRCGC
ncbi:MAG: hypothetical protein ACOZQL_39430 [Myxococcota bacterium]